MSFKIHSIRFAMVVLTLVTVMTGSVFCQEPLDMEGEKGYLAIFYPMKNTVLSSEITGTVRTMAYDMGQGFKQGDTLVLLDSGYMTAAKDKARAALMYAEEALQSKKKLHDQKSVSTLEYIKAESDFVVSKANLAIAEKRLDACTIRAPYTGKVVKQMVRENELILEGQPLIEIIDDSMIQVKFHLPASLYASIRVGQRYWVSAKNVASEFKCKITHISPVMESNTNSFQVFAEVKNSKNLIRAGMTGFVKIDNVLTNQ